MGCINVYMCMCACVYTQCRCNRSEFRRQGACLEQSIGNLRLSLVVRRSVGESTATFDMLAASRRHHRTNLENKSYQLDDVVRHALHVTDVDVCKMVWWPSAAVGECTPQLLLISSRSD